MSQHDMNLENQAGAAFRADLNEALKALVGQSSGDTAPATTYAFMRWFDTASEELKERDGDNASWRVVAKVVNGELVPYSQGVALSPYGLKNLLINGNFPINERGYVSGTATTAANQFTLDRWYVEVSGESITFTASGNGNQVTAPAGGMSQVVLGENIEGGEYTLSWTGSATAEVNGATVDNGGQVTLPANTHAKVTFVGGTVEEAQLEPGSVKTPFPFMPRGFELFLCKRFHQKSYARTTCASVENVRFQVEMRVTPTIVLGQGAGATVSLSSESYRGKDGFKVTTQSGSGDFDWTATAEIT